MAQTDRHTDEVQTPGGRGGSHPHACKAPAAIVHMQGNPLGPPHTWKGLKGHLGSSEDLPLTTTLTPPWDRGPHPCRNRHTAPGTASTPPSLLPGWPLGTCTDPQPILCSQGGLQPPTSHSHSCFLVSAPTAPPPCLPLSGGCPPPQTLPGSSSLPRDHPTPGRDDPGAGVAEGGL